MLEEIRKWPYDFPSSKDYLKSNERGTVAGVLRVHDPYAFPSVQINRFPDTYCTYVTVCGKTSRWNNLP